MNAGMLEKLLVVEVKLSPSVNFEDLNELVVLIKKVMVVMVEWRYNMKNKENGHVLGLAHASNDFTIDVIGKTGIDFVVIDMEHGAMS